MPTTRSEGEVKSRWQAFVRALRTLFGALPEHRHQDQYLRIKEAAITLAEGDSFAGEIDKSYRDAVMVAGNVRPEADAVEIVVMELEAFPLAIQVHEAEEKAGTTKPGALKRLQSAAKTILGSVGDLFKLTDTGKAVVTV